MGHRIRMFFMCVEREELKLPILDWLDNDNSIWQLFSEAKDGKTQNTLFDISGKYGLHHADLLQVIDRCNLTALNFLNIDILDADGTGTILQNSELLAPIRSITLAIEELLTGADPLYCLLGDRQNSEEIMLEAFERAKIEQEVDLDYYDVEGLFTILKSLLWMMNDALTKNKAFIYAQFTV